VRGAELIIAPYATPVDDPWENFLTTRALENGVFLAVCNHVGQEGGWRMSGKSMMITPRGKLALQASGSDEAIITVEISREDVFAARRDFPLFRDRRPEIYSVIAAPMEQTAGH
jgi:N-carbamoylputrescine amidase